MKRFSDYKKWCSNGKAVSNDIIKEYVRLYSNDNKKNKYKI